MINLPCLAKRVKRPNQFSDAEEVVSEAGTSIHN